MERWRLRYFSFSDLCPGGWCDRVLHGLVGVAFADLGMDSIDTTTKSTLFSFSYVNG